MTLRPILISGAGLASLLLARALLSHAIPFEIYERDASVDVRGQGYRLRLSAEGIDAVEAVLDEGSFAKWYAGCSKTGGGGMQSLDAVTGEKVEMGGGGGGGGQGSLQSRGGKIVGTARGWLRKSLLEGLEPYVQWQKHVRGYEVVEGGRGVVAIFADGSRSPVGAMLIAGDGVRSEVAQQLSGGRLKVFDTGTRLIHGQAPSSAFKKMGEGVFALHDTSHGPGRKVFSITNVRPEDMDKPDEMLGWTMVGEPGVIEAPGGDFSSVGSAAADLAKDLTKDWNERFRPIYEQMDVPNAAFWKMTCSSPKGVPEWPNEPRVTLIGDSVHSMTPAGGIGANTAMRDSALLGRLLREAGGYRDGLTEEYEKEMRVYGSEAVKSSYNSAREMFGINNLEEM
jgi:2-polyprenyl-6-methoxyphenol hydroxylase-like FAD-dependent oxidoreductase